MGEILDWWSKPNCQCCEVALMSPVRKDIDMDRRGWGFQEIGWLLDEVCRAGGSIPDRYMALGHTSVNLAAVRRERLCLGRAISCAFSWERMHPELTSEARSKKRVDDAAKISAQVARIVRAMERDKLLTSGLSGRLSGHHNSAGCLIAWMKDLESSAAKYARDNAPSIHCPTWR